MRLKLTLVTLFTAVALATGCSQFDEEPAIVGGIDSIGRISQFSAQQPVDDESRAGIEELKSIWHGDDALTVVRFDAGQSNPVIVNCASIAETLTPDKKGIIFGCTSNSNDDATNTFIYKSGEQYALYPQIANPVPSNFSAGAAGSRNFSVELAEQQSAEDGSFRYPLLIGKWDDVNQMFCFVNPFATLKFTVKAPAGQTLTLRKMQVVGRDGEMMWGNATISANTDKSKVDAVAVVEKNQNVKAVLDCQGQTITDAGRDVYICVPAQTYAKGLSISFICDEGRMDKDLKTSGLTTMQNQLVVVPALELDELDPSGIYTALLRATDTTLAFGWTTLEANAPYLYNIIPKGSTHNYSAEKENTYLLELFKDEACTQLQVSWQISGNTTTLDGGDKVAMFSDVNNPQRFIFSGLTPSTNYYLRITSTDGDGAVHKMAHPRVAKTLAKAYTGSVTGSKATAGSTILFENFASLMLGGDMTTRSAGYSIFNKDTATTLAAATATGATPNVTNSSAYYLAPYDTEHNLFETALPLIPAMGLGNWAWDGDNSKCVLGLRPGYVKIGGSSKHGMLLTPALSALSEASTIRVRLKASVVGGMTVDDAERPVAIKVVDNVTVDAETLQATSYDVISTAEFLLEGDQATWNEYEVVLSGATPTSRVLIMGNREGVDVQSRIEVDDIHVMVESVDGVAVAQVRATDTNLTIGWTVTAKNIPYISTLLVDKKSTAASKMDFTTDLTHTYKVALYADKECTELVQSLASIPGSTFTNISDTGWIPRFTFSGLTPSTTYYVVVTDQTTSSSSYPLEVKTIASVVDPNDVVTTAGAAKAGSLIIFQNFGKMHYYNDQATVAAGYYLSGHTTATTQPAISGEATVGANNQGRKVTMRMAKDGVGLFNNHMPSVEYLGLKNWGWYGDGSGANGSSIGFMAGYAKVGSGTNSTTIYTPALAALPSGKECIVRVTFKAAPYGTPSTPVSTDDKKVVKISAVKAPSFDASTSNTSTAAKVTGGTVVSSDTITLEGDYTNWQEYSVTLPFVTSDCRIGIGGNNSQTTERFFLDDIRVEVVSTADGLWCDLVRATDTTLSIGWSITESNVTSGLYKSLFPNTPDECKKDHNGYGSNNYTIYLYRDEACTDIEFQTDFSGEFFAYGTATTSGGVTSYPSNFPARYIFGGLKPNTQYWFKVKDKKAGVTAGPLPVKTLPMAFEGDISKESEVGDVVLFQNFGKFLYGGDITNYSAGYTEANRSSTTKMHKAQGKVSWSAQTIDGEAVDFGRTSAQSYYNIFDTMGNLVEDMGMSGWSYYADDDKPCVFMRPGYMRVGGNDYAGAVCTPELSSIKGVANVKVTFKAAYFTTVNYKISENEKLISVRNHKGGTVTDYKLDGAVIVDEQTVTLDSSRLGEWQEFSVTLTGVESDCRIALAGGRVTSGVCRFMVDDIKVEITGVTKTISGKISAPSSAGGKGVAGIAVTDGYSTTLTDANGKYKLPYNEKARFVQYTTPANYEIGRDGSGYPIYYKKFDKNTLTYNFTLGTKFYYDGTLADGISNYNTAADKHNKWFLYVMADPQTHDDSVDKCMDRFKSKVCKDLKYTVKQRGYNTAVNASDGTKQAIGIVLGDIGWDSIDGEDHHADMKTAMGVNNTGVYWFTVPGNHDYNFNKGKTSRSIDEFEAAYGPSNFSFERGDVHVVALNSCQFSGTSYSSGLSEYEFNWLVRDLSTVDRSKCVVLCIHVPSFNGGLDPYKTRILSLLSEFDKAYIFSGHRHAAKAYLHQSIKEIFEVNHAAACGQFWNVSMCNDGSPAGYSIYTFTGNDITVQRFKAIGTNDVGNVNSTLQSNNYIENGLRVYWAADQISNTTTGSNENYVNLYTFGTGQKNALVANVFMGHAEGGTSGIAQSWKVEFSEDSGSTWKSMTLMTSSNRHSAPAGLYATTQAYGTDAFNYKTYVVDSNGYNLNSSNYSGTAVTHSSSGNANTGKNLYIRNDLDWWMWGMTMDRGNNTATGRDDTETGNCWSYSNVSPHMFWGTMSKSYSSVSAVQSDVKSGKLQIRAYLPGNYSHTYTADKITEFKVYSNTGREGIDWKTATVPSL